MGTTYSWTGDMARNSGPGEAATAPPRSDRFRRMFDRSHLLDRANSICESFNRQAGMRLIRAENSNGTHPVIGRYVIDDQNETFLMELAILSDGPELLFSYRKARPWLTTLQRRCGYHAAAASRVVCKLQFNPTTVTDFEIRRWFTYLLSGLDRALKPQPMEPLLLNVWLGGPTPAFEPSK